MAKSEKPKRGDVATYIYEKLRSEILMLRLAPGSTIDEASIVREYQVSRTPVREAIVRLASDGLAILLPNRGSQVAPLNLARVRDYLEAMDVVQPAVTALCAKRSSAVELKRIRDAAKAFDDACTKGDREAQVLRNRDFHLEIGRACGNDLLLTSYQRLLDEGLRISPLSLNARYAPGEGGGAEFTAEISRQHWQIVKAIEMRDMTAAAGLADTHTETTREWFSGYLSDGYTGKRGYLGS